MEEQIISFLFYIKGIQMFERGGLLCGVEERDIQLNILKEKLEKKACDCVGCYLDIIGYEYLGIEENALEIREIGRDDVETTPVTSGSSFH